ncbi:hypothetical protein C8J57DRAFT_1714109 [Mycena rebaudengoi]|nr:hypothetical protein C8J57DRAFT_1714109 [Mycena rebaudengoi]
MSQDSSGSIMVPTSHSEATVLPLELQQRIFELTGVLYPRMIPILMCLCRYAFHCMEPIRYRTIIFMTTRDDVVEILRRMNLKEPAGFFERAVRRLLVVNDTMLSEQPPPDEEIERILRVCTGVESLLITTIFGTTTGLVPSLLVLLAKYLRPKFLSLQCHDIDEARGRSNAMLLFQNVTHLHLQDTPRSSGAAWPFWGQLSRIGPLTHLALSKDAPPPVLPDILSQCPQLQALVLVYKDKEDVQMDDILLYDARTVLMTNGADELDWEGIDTFIKQKQLESGSIEGRSSGSTLQPKAHTHLSIS